MVFRSFECTAGAVRVSSGWINVRGWVLALACLVPAGVAAAQGMGTPRSAIPAIPGGRPDAALVRLFTPRDVPAGAYEVFTTERSIDACVAALRPRGVNLPDAAWRVGREEPLTAFGPAGAYNRARLAALYVGVRPRVARGPILSGGRVVASVTLISPYPDPQLETLRPGTLVIVLNLSGR